MRTVVTTVTLKDEERNQWDRAQSREHWARWHDDETFKATPAELAELEEEPSTTVWYDVVEEQG